MNVHTEPAHGRAFPPQGGSAGDRACADLPGFRPMVQAKDPAPPAGLSARQSVAGILVATATGEMASATRRLPLACAPLLRLHTICSYYTMFPLDFPFRCLAKAEPGEWVLDPFCGRGSTVEREEEEEELAMAGHEARDRVRQAPREPGRGGRYVNTR